MKIRSQKWIDSKVGISDWEDRIIEVDEFIAELWQVHLKVKEEGYVQVSGAAESHFIRQSQS